MNKLSTEERKAVVAALVEGNSLRAATRMTGIHRTSVIKLLCDLGRACSEYQDKIFRNLQCKRIQCDEVWTYILAKDKNCTAEQKAKGAGDAWTWVAIDPDSKLVPCWFYRPARRRLRLSLHARSESTTGKSRATDDRRA